MTPSSPRRDAATAARAPGSTTPITGSEKLALQRRERVRGGRVAGDDDRLDVLRRQELADLATVAPNGVGALRSVREARRVTEVDDPLVRQLPNDLADDGETADAGVEDTDW